MTTTNLLINYGIIVAGDDNTVNLGRSTRPGRAGIPKVNNEQFCQYWCEHYGEGIEAVASAAGLSTRWTWLKYCELVAQGVRLPEPSGYNEHAIVSSEVNQLNRRIRHWLSLRQ